MTPSAKTPFRRIALIATLTLSTALGSMANANNTVTLNDFYRAYELSEITPENMQSWPYYKHVSMNWDDYALFGTAPVFAAEKPAELRMAENQLDLGQEFRDGKSFAQSLQDTQTKGFLVMKENVILGEFYDNGFSVDQTQLLQSSSKTYAGIVVSKLIDEGHIEPEATVASVLQDFQGTAIGAAKIRHVLDMTAGLLPATDYHVPGGEAFVFETEQGLKPGAPSGHRAAVRTAKTQNEAGEVYTYNDKNTDLLAMLAEAVTGVPFARQLTDLFNEFGAQSDGSISLSVDGTASPSYGISTTLRDYGLFTQWIAQGKAPESFLASVTDVEKDLLSVSEKGKGMAQALGTKVTYGSQGWYLPEHNVVMSIGSYGQVGFSDLNQGISVVFMQDWEDNGVAEKLVETVDRALKLIGQYSEQ
ncbi:CubicO group peptidase (beta-lactamase class C family) [Shimia isoporae]|uniref:CubicO group peptidase (Beta-lactamase class C family) n=1 Tax=Shimia isoporae TaxID=647720 RepID=A0A4R1NJU2_9RHOB|nr:serine hydrolase domain-containing protein [Shimia isoporae]TCL08464.1 CubicO group peptidase (beta-lactamase class C family) [Shimia isoporae]